jgi:hypothetical protein
MMMHCLLLMLRYWQMHVDKQDMPLRSSTRPQIALVTLLANNIVDIFFNETTVVLFFARSNLAVVVGCWCLTCQGRQSLHKKQPAQASQPDASN